jgi:serine/threonine protein kinase/Tfp pilus assembly protein PilF
MASELVEHLASALADRYTIERELGRGGMATVYLAHDAKHQRQVALKVLKPELAAALGADRFLHEIRVTARLNHPHILPLHDSGEAQGFLFYTMPFVAGESVRRRLDRERQLSIEHALRITEEVAAALDYAHRQGVIHRDIKPENILLHEGEAVVADFGVALAVQAAAGERMTETGLSVGTPQYMSPEQVTGDREIDGRSDFYSLACVLYEMLTGELPYMGVSTQSVMAKRFTDPIPSARRLRGTIPLSVDGALQRALALAPPDRFANGTEFIEALAAEDAETRPARRGIAVLPFDNLSHDRENAYFSDGLTEEIITALSRVPALRVVSRTSVMQYKDVKKSLRDIARELEVDTVVEGSVRKAGDRVRITAQAIDGRGDEHLWSETYDRQLEDIFEIQSDVASRICDAIRAELSETEKADLAQPGTSDVAAYDLYLKARYLWNQRTPSGLHASVGYFRKAIGRDAAFALAHAGLADSYVMLGVYGASPPHEVMVAAKQAAAGALAIDPTLPRALTARACVRATYDWDWAGAEQDFKTALQHDPGDATTHQWYATNVLVPRRRFEEARREVEEAARLEPLSPAIAASSGVTAYFARDYERAMETYANALTLHPNSGLIHYFMGQCEVERGRLAEALQALQRAMELTPPSSEIMAALGHCHASAGNTRQATDILSQLEHRATSGWVSPVLLAQVLTALGDHEAALRKLDEAVELRASDLIWLAVRPVFDPLRSEPRFAELLKAIGLE